LGVDSVILPVPTSQILLVTILIILVSLVALFFLGVYLIGNKLLSVPPYQGPLSDHFDGKVFHNTGKRAAGSFSDVMRWQMDRKRVRGEWKVVDNPPGERPPARVFGKELRVTFIGHATVLIQTQGLNFITDPLYGERAGPYSWAGPKRFKRPGIRFEDLPKIDVILLSHNHYDHLDWRTIKKLQHRDGSAVVTSLGVSRFLEQKHITKPTELDWWDTHEVSSDVRIHSVPARHFSGRGTADRNTTLWAGFVLETSGGNIYFAADTGYDDAIFKEIGTVFGEMRLSVIPIGAYTPRWFMSPVHVDPEQAVLIHEDVRSRKSIGIHWGTFQLADEGMDDPPRELRSSLLKRGLTEDEFVAIAEGECITFSKVVADF
jgi:L-ascorbate metabolism protein UlaG (beta-lactamase superfamily)